MKKVILPLLLTLFATPLCAGEELSDECLRSLQHVYKFYYHEISPKGEPQGKSENLNESEAAHMQVVVNSLKSNCSPTIIGKMNQFLHEDKA